MNLDDVLQTFIAESQELLLLMEDALLRIEQVPDDVDTINALFRVAHTIKGSAGLFGLTPIVAFTHVAESVLDRVRGNELRVDEALSALFLQVRDHLGELIDLLARHGDLQGLTADHERQGSALVARLNGYLEPSLESEQGEAVATPVSDSAGGLRHWHLSLRFGSDVLRNGMDPLSFLRYLKSFGQITRVVCVTDGLPEVAAMDPESCYLGFELGFVSEADQATIESAFEFVREDSQICVLPPERQPADFQALIERLGSDPQALLEVFIACGSLTREDWQAATQVPSATFMAAPEVVPDQPLPQGDGLSRSKPAREVRSVEGNLIRVDAGKLDQLINLVGELIIAGAGANLVAARTGIGEMIEAASSLSRLVEEVRDSALTLRMVQIGATFNRFQRVVRDVSKELGKDIVLEVDGAETELDKTVVERIGDPLTHLVRNAMDHGIEAVQLRRDRGKPAQGTVRLNAYHEASSIVIEVCDDGGGLNKQRILDKARERGLLAEGQVLADKDILNLIFEPGFSTAEQVSSLSGRGVGMDVVKRNITALRGSVNLESEEGVGTTVRIRLPLTLAIIDGFLIGVGKASYVVPLDMVEECIELNADDCNNQDYLDLRGSVLPVLRLREMFAIDEPNPGRENIVVVHYAGVRVGLVVDQLLGEFQTVIKPLGKLFGTAHGLGGFTILGSGAVALILDIPNLLGQVASQQKHGATLSPELTQ
ncbi:MULTISPECIES: chemotaxis protein CheA [Pseudomonas]|uniref:Chemotaxis protein CheA n=1 Tax=Pseudomonas gingeri TaxID=117681 RepID=A0A7Y7WAQ9_9PSED|nr:MULTISPECIES: chemotaxis protein CheA [Pseudomonas]MCU1739041.1 chemotaxis protein CheA [Pseudomonas sp. 20S_6.2_Bac1]NWB45877.1 chemotaxis protein CheA [Pseudomonas gingeri]